MYINIKSKRSSHMGVLDLNHLSQNTIECIIQFVSVSNDFDPYFLLACKESKSCLILTCFYLLNSEVFEVLNLRHKYQSIMYLFATMIILRQNKRRLL